MIFAIDPGPEKSAWVVLDERLKPQDFGIYPNDKLLAHLPLAPASSDFVVEMVASYGMPVGKDVFETCVWIGRFWEAARGMRSRSRIYRIEEKTALCRDSRAKDGNLRQALLDLFGPVGTKKAPGWFYGVSKDVWAAVAVGVTWADKQREG